MNSQYTSNNLTTKNYFKVEYYDDYTSHDGQNRSNFDSWSNWWSKPNSLFLELGFYVSNLEAFLFFLLGIVCFISLVCFTAASIPNRNVDVAGNKVESFGPEPGLLTDILKATYNQLQSWKFHKVFWSYYLLKMIPYTLFALLIQGPILKLLSEPVKEFKMDSQQFKEFFSKEFDSKASPDTVTYLKSTAVGTTESVYLKSADLAYNYIVEGFTLREPDSIFEVLGYSAISDNTSAIRHYCFNQYFLVAKSYFVSAFLFFIACAIAQSALGTISKLWFGYKGTQEKYLLASYMLLLLYLPKATFDIVTILFLKNQVFEQIAGLTLDTFKEALDLVNRSNYILEAHQAPVSKSGSTLFLFPFQKEYHKFVKTEFLNFLNIQGRDHFISAYYLGIQNGLNNIILFFRNLVDRLVSYNIFYNMVYFLTLKYYKNQHKSNK